MSKFNETKTMKTTNKCGAPAYNMDARVKLATMVMTSLVGENKFYGDNTSELLELAQKADMTFVSQLAIYARQVMNLRSISHVLTAIVAKFGKGELTRKTVHGVVQRADDITEILAFYLKYYGKPIPNALKRQIAVELRKFDEFQIAKYNGGNKEVKFRDVLRLVHPTPKNAEENRIFSAILNDTLKTPYTWETELSAHGNNAETWYNLIESKKVGYMALLRNLRNIYNANPTNIDKVYKTIANENAVHASKQLPFRFLSAYKENRSSSSKLLTALETAAEISCDNIKPIKGKTLIAIDVSGSMGCYVSNKSSVTCAEIACMLGAMASHICEDAEVVTFDTKLKQFAISKKSGIISSALTMSCHGGGTDLRLPISYMLDYKKWFDRIIILSDNQINSSYGGYTHVCQSLVNRYRQQINPNLFVHAIDLCGYGTSQFIGDRTNLVGGWSERVLELIPLFEDGCTSFISDIMNYRGK